MEDASTVQVITVSLDLAKNALQSYVRRCAASGEPGVATRVAERRFADWVTARSGIEPIEAHSRTASSRGSIARRSTSTSASKNAEPGLRLWRR